jgi:hypothetical protein
VGLPAQERVAVAQPLAGLRGLSLVEGALWVAHSLREGVGPWAGRLHPEAEEPLGVPLPQRAGQAKRSLALGAAVLSGVARIQVRQRLATRSLPGRVGWA